jgi:hypothetical protein
MALLSSSLKETMMMSSSVIARRPITGANLALAAEAIDSSVEAKGIDSSVEGRELNCVLHCSRTKFGA